MSCRTFPERFHADPSNVDANLRYRAVLDLVRETYRSDLSVLEVGSGSGGLAEYLDHPVTGVDSAFERTAERGATGLTRVRGTAEALPFHDASFDLVVCCEVLEHVPRDRREPSLQEMVRVLRANGRLIVTVPADAAAERLDRRLNEAFRAHHGRDHPWVAEHVAAGLPRTSELEAAIRRAAPADACLTVHKHLWGPSWFAMQWVYTVHRLYPLMKLLGLHSRLGAGAVIALLSRMNFGDCYRRIFVLDLPPHLPQEPGAGLRG